MNKTTIDNENIQISYRPARRSCPMYWANEVSFRSVLRCFGRQGTGLTPPVSKHSEAISMLKGLKVRSLSKSCADGWRGLVGQWSSNDLDLARLLRFFREYLNKAIKSTETSYIICITNKNIDKAVNFCYNRKTASPRPVQFGGQWCKYSPSQPRCK